MNTLQWCTWMGCNAASEVLPLNGDQLGQHLTATADKHFSAAYTFHRYGKIWCHLMDNPQLLNSERVLQECFCKTSEKGSTYIC